MEEAIFCLLLRKASSLTPCESEGDVLAKYLLIKYRVQSTNDKSDLCPFFFFFFLANGPSAPSLLCTMLSNSFQKFRKLTEY